MDKTLIIKEIKEHYNFKKDSELAKHLGISSQVLTNWKSRNTYDAELIYTKCLEINPEWLLTGKGDMLKKDKDLVVAAPVMKGGFPLLPIEAFAGLGDSNITGVDFDTIEERYVIPLFDGLKIDFMIAVVSLFVWDLSLCTSSLETVVHRFDFENSRFPQHYLTTGISSLVQIIYCTLSILS